MARRPHRGAGAGEHQQVPPRVACATRTVSDRPFSFCGGEAVPNASNVAEVEAIKGRLEGSVAALLTEYRGLKVAELGELRASLRGSSTEYRVLK
ncbi:MAG TPA: 50S ribosomal protein L10, partial [Actinomycetota bacterium]|nr:50S ribosomal protein L10 [Actinomycetota bacterium]